MNNDVIAGVLNKAVGYLERGWCRVDFARDVLGQSLYSSDGRAVCWCAVGAVQRAALFMDTYNAHQVVEDACGEVCKVLGLIKDSYLRGSFQSTLSSWNDKPERTQEEVVAIFKKTALVVGGDG